MDGARRDRAGRLKQERANGKGRAAAVERSHGCAGGQRAGGKRWQAGEVTERRWRAGSQKQLGLGFYFYTGRSDCQIKRAMPGPSDVPHMRPSMTRPIRPCQPGHDADRASSCWSCLSRPCFGPPMRHDSFGHLLMFSSAASYGRCWTSGILVGLLR